jgi:diguanylate cyclase (GGDEF)-like protein
MNVVTVTGLLARGSKAFRDPSWLTPRDTAAAAHIVQTLSVVAAAVTMLFAVFGPTESGRTVTILVTAAVLTAAIGGAWSLRFLTSKHQRFWAVCPLLATGAIVGLDLFTHDASVGAQIFFFFPALYGASQLPRPGAITVTLAATGGEIVVALALLPLGTAVISIGYVSATLLTSSALLILGEERQARLVAQLRHLAAVDPLTGLVTRRVLDESARAALSSTASDGTALILLDVDDFKSVNDHYGHPAGDDVLVGLARILADASRPNDVVSRLGGDEVALLLTGVTREIAERRAKKILWDVRAHKFAVAGGHELSITVSVGVAHAPEHAVDLRSLYGAADAALYAAKRAGRNQVATPSAEVVALMRT